MSSSFESREFACESKFYLPAQQAEVIAAWARANLLADPHGAGPMGDCYHVCSVYQDTAGLDVYQRSGSYGRSKYRVRRYGDSSRVFLERKTKTNELVSKRRSLVEIEELPRLENASLAGGWPGYWFHRRLRVRALRPVCRISYDRMARIGSSETGPVRLTIDRNLRAGLIDRNDFARSIRLHELLDAKCIMELKYRHALPGVFRRMLAEFAPVSQTISKYRLACPALGLARDAAPSAAAEEVADA